MGSEETGKEQIREAVWDRLKEEKVGRFPFVPRRRIPNFSGAEAAAKRLVEHPLFEAARVVKINPDSPQRAVREAALEAGKIVVVPTPRLTDGFLVFDPEQIDAAHYRDASMISRWEPYATRISLEELPSPELIVTGCVAVTRDGKRAGKGHGYGDLEYAILRELGHRPAPVVTTVHQLQVVEDFAVDAHDLWLSLIVTPEEIIEVDHDRGHSQGIDWSLLDEADLEAMPVLKELHPGK